ncbi:MAG: signal peptidase II [Oscillospiraceae bacterium]|nr:signal peptidase II [Oscillospiraceae bacterium]
MKKILIFTGFLFAIDQGVKLLISYFIGENHIPIIPNFFHIHPYLNDINQFERTFNFKIPIIIMLVVCIVAVFFIIFFYRFFNFVTKKWRKLLTSFTSFTLAGMLCACIDQIVWGGSLDYMCFYRNYPDDYEWFCKVCNEYHTGGTFHSYIFDLKDIYIDIGFILILILIIIMLIEYYKNFSKEERKKHTLKWLFKWIGRGCPTNNTEQE